MILFILITVVMYTHAASLDEKLAYMDNVKELVLLTGKMRDNIHLSNSGGYIMSEEIERDQDEVSTSLRSLRHKFHTVDYKIDNDFSTLNLYMQSLNDVVPDLDALTKFKAYTLLASEMIVLGQKAQKRLFFYESTRNKRISSVMLENIVPMMEHISLLRGFGSKIAVNSEFEDGERDELRAYIVKVLDDVDNLALEMGALKWEYPALYSVKLERKLIKYRKNVKYYIGHIESKLLETDQVELDYYDFYMEGTSLIDQTIEFYEINEAILRDHPEERFIHVR